MDHRQIVQSEYLLKGKCEYTAYRSSTPIHNIPLDAWIIILRFIDKQALVETFNNLFSSNIFNIPEKYKLDTFWLVVSQARYMDYEDILNLERSYMFRANSMKLMEMGVDRETTYTILRETHGHLLAAFERLGWN